MIHGDRKGRGQVGAPSAIGYTLMRETLGLPGTTPFTGFLIRTNRGSLVPISTPCSIVWLNGLVQLMEAQQSPVECIGAHRRYFPSLE